MRCFSLGLKLHIEKNINTHKALRKTGSAIPLKYLQVNLSLSGNNFFDFEIIVYIWVLAI